MIGYFMTDQPLEFNRFMIFLTMLVLTAFVAQAQGLLIGAATDLEVLSNALKWQKFFCEFYLIVILRSQMLAPV